MHILIADDSGTTRTFLSRNLSHWGYTASEAEDGEEAWECFLQEFPPIILTDLRMPGIDGVELLRRVKAHPAGRDCTIIILTGHGDMTSAVECLRSGAFDYLTKPVKPDELRTVIRRAVEEQEFRQEIQPVPDRPAAVPAEKERPSSPMAAPVAEGHRAVTGIGEIIAESRAMRELVKEALAYHAEPSVPVLIEGETGCGKEVLARLVHNGWLGNAKPLVDLNCSAMNESLFESELFGYATGAFTGAQPGGAKGKLALAESGTLFLDEIGDIPLALQPKLLRVLESREFYPVGATRKQHFRARIICATNRGLEEMVREKRFRRDLYHRLQVGYLRIPPLRERPEEIPALVELFLRRACERRERPVMEITREALQRLTAYAWPGNVRELENTLERAVLTSGSRSLAPEHLSFLTEDDSPAPEAAAAVRTPDDLPEGGIDFDSYCQDLIRRVLEKCGGNRSAAARYLRMSRSAFCRRADRLKS